MNHTIEIKPYNRKDGQKYKIIEVTDIQLHTTKKIPTLSADKKIQKAFKDNKPDRIYGKIEKNLISDNKTVILEMLKANEDLLKMIQEEEANGYKVLLSLPKQGIPVFPGKDTVEFINSKNGKRVIRGLAKEKDLQ